MKFCSVPLLAMVFHKNEWRHNVRQFLRGCRHRNTAPVKARLLLGDMATFSRHYFSFFFLDMISNCDQLLNHATSRKIPRKFGTFVIILAWDISWDKFGWDVPFENPFQERLVVGYGTVGHVCPTFSFSFLLNEYHTVEWAEIALIYQKSHRFRYSGG
jgi:hypothetical protein